VDLVTETDRAVEDLISGTLRERYPDILFVGEETYTPDQKITDEPTFILDPIDGTTNFVHNFPYVCISLGLSVHRIPHVGIVYNPFTKTLYSAIKGHGAFLNETTPLPLRAPNPLALSDAQIAVEWGSDRSGNDLDVKASTFKNLAAADGGMVHSLRSLGSAALNLCNVAAGSMDAYWEAGCWAWDVCAGMCILAETGGVVVDANPGGWLAEMDQRRYFAIRGDAAKKSDEGFSEGQKQFIEEFWKHVEGKFEVGK
jgi:myo-inositol-1(or 4)-monophosphatase